MIPIRKVLSVSALCLLWAVAPSGPFRSVKFLRSCANPRMGALRESRSEPGSGTFYRMFPVTSSCQTCYFEFLKTTMVTFIEVSISTSSSSMSALAFSGLKLPDPAPIRGKAIDRKSFS